MQQLCSYSPKKIEHVDFWGLTILGILCFAVSAFTTGYGVNHILQDSSLAILSPFYGEKGAAPRVFVSFICGCILSYIILHFKISLFRGVLSEGKVFKGIRSVYISSPFRVLLATLMVFVSLKTNYDGGVAFLSKSEYMTEQYRLIHARADTAFAPVMIGEKSAITSFHQSVTSLKESGKLIAAQFKTFPSDEATGSASSGFAGQGSRFWGKSYVITGDYKAIKSSAPTGHDRVAKEVNDVIQASGLDLTLSVEEKISKIVAEYESFVKSQDQQTKNYLVELDGIIRSEHSLLPHFLALAFVEYYDLDRIVKKMSVGFSATAEHYNDTIAQLETMIAKHIHVLTQIDRAGNAKARIYKVSISFPPMNTEAVAALTQGLPKVKYLSFVELTQLLRSKYGVVWAQVVVAPILTLSGLIDLADLVFLGPSLAARGRKEAEIIATKQEELNDWEEKFLKQVYIFLYDDEIAQVYNRLIPSKGVLLMDSFYQLLEEINPRVIDPLDKPISTLLLDYFKSDFRGHHTQAANEYNERIVAIQGLINNPEFCLNRYLEIIFPKLDDILRQSDFTFAEIDRRIQGEQQQILNRVLKRTEELSEASETSSFYAFFKTKRRLKRLTKEEQNLSQKLIQCGVKGEINALFDYGKMRRETLEKKLQQIRTQLSNTTLELETQKTKAEHYLTSGTADLNKLAIAWKMALSFIAEAYNPQMIHSTHTIMSRRRWLSMIGHKVNRPNANTPTQGAIC
ncbi:hypothetical protein WDW86_04930 [Bdellovibrionota bacterium FG-2]